MIKITNLNKYYKSGQGSYHALKNINLTFPDKGLVFITGKSGSGKSTLLNIIGGIDSYDSGDLEINNISTKSFSKEDYNTYRNTYIGFIFQEFNVIKSLTVYENVALSIQLHHKRVKENHQKILDVISQVGLKNKEHRKMNQISGGEKQRVAIARALIKNPQVIIADEPTGNLDSKNRDIVINILKKLAEDRLVLVVTHDQHLANLYADRTIVIKDGEVINDTKTNEPLVSNQNNLTLNPISIPISTSLSLGLKAFKKNLIRYILIIVLFSFSLIFAGSVVNLYLADTTLEYANYQKDYNNFVIDLNQTYTENNISVQSAFDNYNYNEFVNRYTSNGMTTYKSIVLDLDITTNSTIDSSFYQSKIDRVNLYETNDHFKNSLLFRNFYEDDYNCYITDYVAKSLIEHNYFNEEISDISDVVGKYLKLPDFKNSVYIQNIIDTNYETFETKYLNGNFNDSKVSVTFSDNLPYYNAIYILKDAYENDFIKYARNITTVTDNIIYTGLNHSGYQENVKITVYYDSLYNSLLTGKEPVKPQSGEPTQLAVSKGVLMNLYKKNPDSAIQFSSSALSPGLLNNEGYTAYFRFTGVKRSQATYNFIITGIIDTNDYVIYLPSYTYQAYLTASYIRGGCLMATINEDAWVNASIYRDMLDNDITINNLSFNKLQIVDDFISDNLFLFAALFFVLCLFSILMIFNFILINIKNSTRDIGIYMSLGMSGFKISFIYLFQVLLVSSISLITGIIGSRIFLFILDAIFSAKSPINFEIIKYTPLGVLVMFIIAFVAPVSAVIFPLINLSLKKPIDVIKVS